MTASMNYSFGFISIFFFVITSCSNAPIGSSIELFDKFILEYDKEDFSEIENVSIVVINKGFLKTQYLVSLDTLPGYFVEYDELRSRVSKAEESVMLKGLESKSLYNSIDFEFLISYFRKFDFGYLRVDKEGNSYINPFEIGSPPVFLRLKEKSVEESIKKGFVFKHYRNRWYVRSSVYQKILKED